MHYFRVLGDRGQLLVNAAWSWERKSLVIVTEQVQDCGVEVLAGHLLVDDRIADLIGTPYSIPVFMPPPAIQIVKAPGL